MVSLLGLLVVGRFSTSGGGVPQFTLDALATQGWPRWQILVDDSKNPTTTLPELLRHFRNALAHGRFFPDSDSRDPHQVTVTFEDAPGEAKPVNWRAVIGATELLAFCERLAELVHQADGSATSG